MSSPDHHFRFSELFADSASIRVRCGVDEAALMVRDCALLGRTELDAGLGCVELVGRLELVAVVERFVPVDPRDADERRDFCAAVLELFPLAWREELEPFVRFAEDNTAAPLPR